MTGDALPETPDDGYFRARWLVLAVLALIYVCNVADRLVLSILAQDVKADLHLSDFEVGLLVGPAIAFFYAILGIPMAFVADRVNRVRFLALCLAMWSILTALGGATANALQLGLARIGVSAVEAGGSPASSSIIADYFPERERPTAMGIYSAGSTIGILVSFALGGLINAHFGWRWTLVAAGTPGVLLTLLLILTVREPPRGLRDGGRASSGRTIVDPHSMLSGLALLWRIRFYRQVVIAAGLSNFCFQMVLNWSPSLIMRKFFAASSHAGVWMGVGIAICGGGAAIIGGRVISRLAAQGMSRPLRIAAVLQVLSVPLTLAALFAPWLPLCVTLLCIAYGLQSFFVPIYWSVSQSHVPPAMRGLSSALMLLSIAIWGHGIAAPAIGALSDWLAPTVGAASLQYAVAIGLLMNLLTTYLFVRAAATARRERTTESDAMPA